MQIDIGGFDAPEILGRVTNKGGILQLELHRTEFGLEVGQPGLDHRAELATPILGTPDLDDHGQFVCVRATAKLHGRLDLNRLDIRFGDNAQRLAGHLKGFAELPFLYPHLHTADAKFTALIFEFGKLEDQAGVGRIKVGDIGIIGLEHPDGGCFKLSRRAACFAFDDNARSIH